MSKKEVQNIHLAHQWWDSLKWASSASSLVSSSLASSFGETGQGGWSFDGSGWLIAKYLAVNHLSIDRFDIVVASEKDDDGKTRTSSSGSSVFWRYYQYDNDTLYINGKDQYEALFERLHLVSDKYWQPTLEKGSKNELFHQLANTAQALTVDKDGNPKFTLKLLDDEPLTWRWPDRFQMPSGRSFQERQIKGQTVLDPMAYHPFKNLLV